MLVLHLDPHSSNSLDPDQHKMTADPKPFYRALLTMAADTILVERGVWHSFADTILRRALVRRREILLVSIIKKQTNICLHRYYGRKRSKLFNLAAAR
jgi:hypothetical protein